MVARYSIHYPLIKFTCKKVEDKRTDVSTHAVPRPACLTANPDSSGEASQEELTEDKIIDELNKVRKDILQRHYGIANIGKEAFSLFKYWDVLQMGANIFLTKPNTVTAKKNLFLLFINSKYPSFLTNVASTQVDITLQNCCNLLRVKNATFSRHFK